MPTVADVWRAVFPRATAAAEPPERDVGWVRVLKPRVPAFDALESRDLAILPLSSLRELSATGPIDASGVVEALARAAGSAIVVVGATAEEPLTSAALERAVDLGMGAFALPETDVQALERSVIGYLVNGRAELERQAGMLETQLERLALEGGDLEAQAATIARFLGRPVAIERPRGKPLAVHAPADVEGSAAAAAAYLAQPRRVALRLRLPDSAAPVGALVLLGTAPLSELDRVAAERVAGLLALELRRGPTRVEEGSPRATGATLPADGPPWVAIVARQMIPGEPSGLDERERLRADLTRLGPARRIALRGDAASLELRVIAVTGDEDAAGLAVAARIAALADRPVAVSRPFSGPEERSLAEAEARATLEAVEALASAGLADAARDSRSNVIGRADRLPAYRLLAALPDMPDGQRQARALLGPLLDGRPEHVAERSRTLRAVLDAESLRDAAQALGIHRNSLTYRLARIEERTGWDLHDPSLRLALGIALRIVQSAQDSGASAHPTALPSETSAR